MVGFIIGFIIGLAIGGLIGLFGACLCVAASKENYTIEDFKTWYKEAMNKTEDNND